MTAFHEPPFDYLTFLVKSERFQWVLKDAASAACAGGQLPRVELRLDEAGALLADLYSLLNSAKVANVTPPATPPITQDRPAKKPDLANVQPAQDLHPYTRTAGKGKRRPKGGG